MHLSLDEVSGTTTFHHLGPLTLRNPNTFVLMNKRNGLLGGQRKDKSNRVILRILAEDTSTQK